VTISILSPKSEAHWFGFDSLVSFSSLPIEGLKRDMFWIFGLVGFSFNASLEPQLRARRRARLAEDALVCLFVCLLVCLFGGSFVVGLLLATIFGLGAPGPTPGPHVRLSTG
jgi:hypothetical protein